MPVLAVEQYPAGLGPTLPELAELLEPAEIHAKRHFSWAGGPEIRRACPPLS